MKEAFKNCAPFIKYITKTGVATIHEVADLHLVLLKCLSNFWRSLEMPLISWKVKLKLKWLSKCVLSVNGDKMLSKKQSFMSL